MTPQRRMYRLAVVLSGVSAVLGVAREIWLVGALGLGSRADALQYVLSITYTISLLGEAVRLASLNQLRQGFHRSALVPLALGISAATLVATAVYARTAPAAVPPWWMVAAGIGGAGNLVFSALLPHFQYRAPFLPVHATTVLPNILIFGGLAAHFGGVIPGGAAGLVPLVILLFVAAPVAQLLTLGVLSRWLGEVATVPGDAIAGAQRIGLHAAGSVGSQAAQYFIRTILLQAAPGALAAFALCLRAIETARTILVDTYIATRVRTWASGQAVGPRFPLGRVLRGLPLALSVAAGAVIALLGGLRAGPYLVPIAVVLLLGSYPAAAVRIRYYVANTVTAPTKLIAAFGGLEVGSAALIGAAALLPSAPPLLVVWMLYQLKPALALAVLERVQRRPGIPDGGTPPCAA